MVDKYELLELFESEPKILGDEEAGIYEYKRQDKYGFTFKMSLFLYDECCSITLEHKDLKYPLFNLGFDKLDYIKCKDEKLIIQQINNSKNVTVLFKPNYAMTFEDRLYL